MRTVILTVLLVVLTVCAGCAEPGGDDDGPDVTETGTPTDNDVGAEPENPPNGTSPTVIEGTAGEGANETTANETTANETTVNETTATAEATNDTTADVAR